MKSRFLVIVVSLVLAAAATLGAAFYIVKLKSSITEGQKLVDVVVTKTPVKAGESVSELFATGAISVQKIPKQYVADQAIGSINGYGDRVLASNLAKGEQITQTRFRKKDETGLAHKVPDNMVAIAIAIDEVTGVGGKLRPGDRVDVIATFSEGAGNDGLTKIMLQNIQVLATPSGTADEGGGLMKGQESGTGKKTVTLAVYPGQAEKVVFASEKGHVWLALRDAENTKAVATNGQSVGTVFK